MANSISSPIVECSTLVELLRCRAFHQPGQRAYTFLLDGETESVRLTYGELDQQARAIAARLQSLGVTGSRALLLYPPGLEFIAAFFGCLYAGVVAVPVYPPRPNRSMSRIQAIVTDAQVKVALTTTSIWFTLEQRLAQTPDLQALHWLKSDSVDSDLGKEWQAPSVTHDTLAWLQYTSGSTATPKGVMVSHRNILYNSEYIKQAFELTPDSLSVSWLPHFHDMGLIDGMIQPLYTGFPGVLMPPLAFLQQPIRWLRMISRYKATHCGGPNFGYDLCCAKVTAEELEFLDLSSWCSAYSGAEPVRRETLECFTAKFSPCGFRASFFYPCYGLAEATLMVSGGLVKDEPIYCIVQADVLEQNRFVEVSETNQKIKHLVGCGRSWLDTKIVIADPESRTLSPPGKVGEIWVSGSTVAQGYWQKPLETEQSFQAYLTDTGDGPFLRTGDLGFIKDGELFVTGRLKDIIIIRGRNHYPQDIELTVEQSHLALRPSCGAAFAVEINGVEQLVIVQEVERSYLRKLNVDEVVENIRYAVRQQHELQVYAVSLLKTQSIPKTSSGKIQRHACREKFLSGELDVLDSGSWSLESRNKQAVSKVGADQR
jgi:acyl-CoA synthetase (AMP-forming)/AMP-acid ligase II